MQGREFIFCPAMQQSNCQAVKLSSGQTVKLSNCQTIKLSSASLTGGTQAEYDQDNDHSDDKNKAGYHGKGRP